MKLATVAQVLARLNTSAATQVTSTVDSALEAATPIVENVIGTRLDEQSRIDWFNYVISDYAANPPFINLYLTQGYLQPGTKLYLSTDGYPVLQTFANAEQNTYIEVDEERGIVTLYAPPLRGVNTIAVTYTAGYASEDSEIPQYLQEAAISCAVRVMHAHKIAHNKDDVPNMASELYRLGYSQLSNYVRPRHNGVAPTKSVIT